MSLKLFNRQNSLAGSATLFPLAVPVVTGLPRKLCMIGKSADGFRSDV